MLCALTAIFVDAKMYLTAGFVGVLAAAALIAFATHYFQVRRANRVRERKKLEDVARRAAAAEVRSEKVEKMRASATEMAKNVSSGAAGLVDVAKTGLSDAGGRISSWRNKRETS